MRGLGLGFVLGAVGSHRRARRAEGIRGLQEAQGVCGGGPAVSLVCHFRSPGGRQLRDRRMPVKGSGSRIFSRSPRSTSGHVHAPNQNHVR